MSQSTPITELLTRWRAGEPDAADGLMRVVYPLLREIAQSRLNRQGGATLQPTELANEAYARLHQVRTTDWTSRAHFFAFSAKVIRGLAVDHLRARASDKRGGGFALLPLESAVGVAAETGGVDLLAVDRALTELEREDAVLAHIVELKFFSGLSTDEIAEACGLSRASVVRRWRYARAWLADHFKASS
jgi:RNA polymerase sigma factor (TIGR02999 family)